MDFEFYLARIYALSWGAFVLAVIVTTTVVSVLPVGFFADAVGVARGSDIVHGAIPLFDSFGRRLLRVCVAAGLGTLLGAIGKHTVVWSGSYYLKWRGAARRENIEQTLPGAVRYLRALAAGSTDQRTLLRKVAEQDAYGETAVAFRRALNHAALTGSLDSGLRRVARDTPSNDLLSPFLLKFGEYAGQGSDALSGYLRMESRMLSHRQSRAQQ